MDHRGWQGPDGKRRPIARWILFSDEADVFATDILPFLIIKRDQLLVWMEARKLMYRRGYMPGGLPEDEIAARRKLVAKVKELKRLG